MPYGIWKIHHAIQTQEARKDWQYIAGKLREAGRQDLIDKYQPGEDWGWKRIDKSLEAVAKAMGWPSVYEMRKQEP